MYDLICISHLRWDFVWQRPQHIMARLAQHQRVFFVEEPIASEEAREPELQTYTWTGSAGEQVTVIRLIQPVDSARWIGHGDPLISKTYRTMLFDYLVSQQVQQSFVWLYTPMGLNFIPTLRPKLVIYDVMDQLSAFKEAPKNLTLLERDALARANIVFTGGISLYYDKKAYARSIYPFPSGVEVEHFSTARNRNAHPIPSEIAELSGPIIGYYGVIDERMDLTLLRYIAEQHPEWNIMLVGPVVKIDPRQVPQLPNIHVLGMRSYDQLPGYLAHFDVALIPFAMNEATRFLSPTKTLEYLAADKPVISTPIHDVIELYGSVVNIGYTPHEFVAHIEDELTHSPTAEHREAVKRLLEEHTWEAIVARMKRLIHRKMQAQLLSKLTSSSQNISPAVGQD
jgi:glycosyltransferase involved in cell wall biosynthesis